jgi:type II secretory pathway component GspD/PulD (secretin)
VGTATGSRSNIRVLNLHGSNAEEALQRLQRIWPSLRGNPLQIDKQPTRSAQKRPLHQQGSMSKDQRPARGKRPESKDAPTTNRTGTTFFPVTTELLLAQSQSPAKKTQPLPETADSPLQKTEAKAADRNSDAAQFQSKASDVAKRQREAAEPNTALPPGKASTDAQQDDLPGITITEGPDGQLIISSQDPAALDTMEDLLEKIVPQHGDYEVFRLQHASPASIEATLREVFGLDAPPKTSPRTGLRTAVQPTLQFISDLDTGTLLVQGATPDQLDKIAELIKLYDKPEELNEELHRQTELYRVQFSRASAVAEAVKDVYRDLLSSDDKAFDQPSRKEGDKPSRSVGYSGNYTSTIPKFKGLLSIGVEEHTNTLVISAPVYLMPEVLRLVKSVDRTASDYGVSVMRTHSVSAEHLRSVLPGVLGATTTTSAPAQAQKPQEAAASQPPTTPQAANPQDNNPRGRNRNR